MVKFLDELNVDCKEQKHANPNSELAEANFVNKYIKYMKIAWEMLK